ERRVREIRVELVLALIVLDLDGFAEGVSAERLLERAGPGTEFRLPVPGCVGGEGPDRYAREAHRVLRMRAELEPAHPKLPLAGIAVALDERRRLSRRVRIHHRGLEWLLDLHPGTGITYQETEHGCRPKGGNRESPAARTLLGHRVLPTVRVRNPLASRQAR